MENEISSLDLKEIIQSIIRKWYIPFISTILCLVAAFVISFYVIDPVYQSSTTLYIGKNIDKTTDITYNDLMLGSQLVKDYRELVKSRFVSRTVIERLGLNDMSIEQLSQKLDVKNKNDTRIIEISTKDTNPKLAMDITNAVAEVFKTKVVDIMQVESVQIIDKAEEPTSPISPNKKLYLAIAFVLGLFLGVFIVLAIEYFDNTAKTPEDIEKYLGLPVIGTIPVFPKS